MSVDGAPHPILELLPELVDDLAADLSELRCDMLDDDWPKLCLADGLAGVAFALWHGARVTGNEQWGQWARDVAADAVANRDDGSAFTTAQREWRVPGPGSVFSGPSGLAFVARLVGIDSAPQQFDTTTERHGELVDGSAGQVCAALVAGADSVADAAAQVLLDRALPDEHGGLAFANLDHTGLAHGVGGAHLALLLWSSARDRALPSWFAPSLAALAELGVPWPSFLSNPEGGTIGGWCNGSPGLVQLYVLAHEVLGDSQWADVATRAAADVVANPPRLPSLCCGAIGEAYALLAITRISDDPNWLSAACDRAAAGLGAEQETVGLLSGEAGAFCIAVDLLHNRTTIPFFSAR